jgi:hypothetical protein
MNHALEVSRQRKAVPDEIEDPGPAGDAIREATGRAAYELNVQQYCAAGLNFGYFYDASPIIAYDGAEHPGYTMGSFTESTVPGCRLPHLWLRDGRSLFDALGPAYTLLVFDSSLPTDALQRAAAARSVPLEVLHLDAAEDERHVYSHPLVLARPDLHISWRGSEVPDRPDELLDILSGRAAMAHTPAAA